VLNDWCAEVGREPGEIERSCDAQGSGPEDVGESLLAVGTRLFTMGTDGRESFDLGLVRAWLQFRDEQNRGQYS
jgi:hypothetical protein